MNKFTYIGCIPIEAHPEPPSDQSYCIKQHCPHCKDPMWVSEKKLQLLEAIPNKARMYCLECLVIACETQGITADLCDIGDLQ